MRVTWYGHACFRIEGDRVSIVTDPYLPGRSGLRGSGLPPLPSFEPDVVLMSSGDDEAHSHWEAVPGSPRVFNTLERADAPFEVAESLQVTAFSAREGGDRPEWAGAPTSNAMYLFTVDGVSILHLGDIGTAFAAQQLEALTGKVDVMLALAGGGLTIALDDLDAAIAAIGPRVVIPMHYKIPSLLYDVGPLADFLAHRGDDPVINVDGCSVELTPETLPSKRTTIVLRPLVLDDREFAA